MYRMAYAISLALFFISLTVRLIAAYLTQFDGLYGQDAFAYYQYALALRQALLMGEPPPPFFWPIGFPLFMALIMGLAGTQPIAGQLVNLVAGAAIAPLVYWLVLAYRPGAWRGGLAAGLLVAVAAQLLLSSLLVMSDVVGLFWATLSALCLLLYCQRWQMRWLVVTAVTLALAVLTRWAYGLLLVPWGVSSLLACREQRIGWRQVMAAGSTAVLIGVIIVGAQFLGDAPGEPSHIIDLQVVRWQPLNALRQVTQNSDGVFYYEHPTGLYYLMPLAHPAYIFPLFAPFLLGGLWAIRRQPRAAVGLLLGWPLTVYLFLAGIAWQNWRFPLSFFPPLLVLVGLGFDWTWEQLSARWRSALVIYCLLALVGSTAWAVRDVGRFTAWANSHKQIVRAIADEMPADARLLAFGLTATARHYTDVDVQELFVLEEADLQILTGSDTAVYLLLDPEDMQSRRVERKGGQNFNWLQINTRLREVSRYGPFVLYQVLPVAEKNFSQTEPGSDR